MSKTYVGIKLQDLGLYNTLDPKDKIVIVKDKDEGVLQLKDFFLYVQSNLDLSNYYTSTQADTIFMAKVDAYTRKDADVKFALVEKTYTRTQSDSRFALASDTFNKAEIEGKYASKEQMYTKDLVYTKEESITAFALKTEIPIMPDLTPYSTTAKGDLRWALKVDVFSKTEADARFANINNYYTKSESDNKYALLSNTYTKAETDNKFLDTTEAYTKDYINLNIYTKTQVYTKAETDGKYPLKTDVYTVTAVNDQFAAKSWVYSRADADNTFRKLADSYNRAEVNALIDASKSGLSTDVSNTYYTKTDADNKFELKGTAYNKIDSDAKYALISNSISPSQVASKYYNKTEVDKALGDAATNTSNLFALKTAAVGGISLTPSNLTFTKVDGTSSLVAIPTWNQSTTGNAATATKFQTARSIGITGAVTAAGISFDGTSNININATSLDATKLTGIVPNASLTGLYSNMDIQLNNNRTIYTTNSSAGRTVYGLADFQCSGAFTGCIVFKTTIPKNNNTMFQLHISGMLYGDGILDTIVKTYQYQGDLKTSGARISRGTADVLIRFGATPDGYICIIIGDVNREWYFPHISITHGVLSSGIAGNYDYVKGWTSYNTNDLTGYTMITTPYVNDLSVTNVAWGNVQSKPTTVSGYGITDAYTKSDIYTKTESDNRFSLKQESIKSATLNTTTLSFTKADNTVNNITIPTWNQDTGGNSATATKLKTPITINGVSFDGSSNITTPAYGTLYSLNQRGVKPYQVPNGAITTYFVDRGKLEIDAETYNYNDLVVFNSWTDPSGGNLNALLFGKSVGQGIWHYFTGQNSTTWGTAKQLAYTDSNITGNAASASKWLTARTFNITGDATWSATVDGSSDVTGSLTLANTGVIPGTYTKVTVDGKGRATSASNLVPADIPNLDMTKVNTGVLGINQGGTGATTAATARNNLGLGTSAVLNVGSANGVASLDASGKVPTSQLYINNTLTSTDTTVPLTAAQGKVLNDSLGITNTNLQTLTNRLDANYYLKSDVFTKTEITTNYFDKTYVNNNFLAQAANKDVSIAGFINAGKDLLFTTSLTGIKWDMNTDNASIVFKNNGDGDTDSYLGFDVGDNGDEYFRWSFTASSSNKIAMSLKRDKLEINNNVATLGLSTSATLTDISKIPQYGIYSKGNIKTDGQIITNATSHHVNISDLATGNDSPIRIPEYYIPVGQTGYIPFLHGSVVTVTNGYTMHSSLGLYRANNTWDNGGIYMAIGGDDRNPTVAFRFKLDGTIDFTGGSVNLVGNTSSATKLQTARTISLTGDGSWSTSFDGTGNSTGSFVLSNSGVTAGTYTKVTVDSKGRVTSGTSLVAGDIPALDTSKLTSGILPIARGGTGAGDAAAARNNLGLTAAATTAITTDKYTGVTGNVMRVGDFGFGGDGLFQQIGGNYNDYKLNAFYTVNNGTNSPENKASAWFNLMSLAHNPNYGTQIATQFTENASVPYTYLRTQFAGTWNKWYKVALEGLDVSFTSLQLTRPSAHTAAPNMFIDTDGVIKKTSFAFGTAATKNTGTNDGDVMTVGSFGIGTNAITYFDNSSTAAVRSSTSGKSGVYRNSTTGATSFIHSPTLYMGTGDTHAMFSIDYNNYGVRVLSWHDSTVNTPFVRNLYHDKSTVIYNTTIDDVANVYIAADGSLKRATKLTYDTNKLIGSINNDNLTGTYSKFGLELANGNTVATFGSGRTTVYGLVDYQLSGNLTGAIVFKTTIPSYSNTMFQVHISGMLYAEGILDTIVKTYQYDGSLSISAARVSRGTVDVNIRFASSPDGYICIIIGDVGKGWYFPHISITHALLSSGVEPGYYKGWTSYTITDLTGYTKITETYNNDVSLSKVYWNNVQNKPTTRDGYALSDVYTKTETNNNFVKNRARSIYLLTEPGSGGFDVHLQTESGIPWLNWADNTRRYYSISGSANSMYFYTIPVGSTDGVAVTLQVNSSYIWHTAYGVLHDYFARQTEVYNKQASDSRYHIKGNPITFPNSTWNLVGDDCYIGDHDIAGRFCIKTVPGAAGNAGITFFNHDETRLGTLYSTADTFVFDKIIDTLKGSHIRSGGYLEVKNDSQTTGYGLALHPTYDASGLPTYGMAFAGIPKFGGHGNVAGDWATYFTTLGAGRGWIFRDMALGNMASISRWGDAQFNGVVKSSSLNSGYIVLDDSTQSFNATTTPMGIGYGRIQSIASIKINANTDNIGDEFVLLTAGKGVSNLTADGFAVFPNRVTWWDNNILDSAGNLTLNGYVSIPHLINRNSGYYGNNRHSFYTVPGAANGINAGNLLLSDDFSQSPNAPFAGLWAKGDVKTGSSLSAAANVYVGNNVQFSTTGSGIRWDMNTDFARIYFKNDGNDDTNSYLGFEVGDDNIEHFKWFVSTAEVMTLRNTGLAVNTIGISNTRPDTGLGISLYGGNSFGQPSHGLFFGGTSTFGVHGDTSADWATYFTMSGGSNRGWIFRSHDNGNVASISARGHAHFSYIHSHGSMYSASEFTTGSYIYAGGYVNTDRLLNRSGTHWSDNRHNFYVHSSGSAQGMSIANLLVSDDYGQVGNVPYAGIWARGDIKSGAWIYSAGKVVAGTDITAGGSITAQGDVTAFSDKRLKENIEPIDNALSKVQQLNGVTYTRNDLEDKEQRYIGLLAQDVTEVFPEAVKENEDGILSLNYSGLIGGLVEAIKELDNKNQALEARLAKLEELINDITK